MLTGWTRACARFAASAQPQPPAALAVILVVETPHINPVESLTYSPGGRLLIISGSRIKLWDIATGQLLKALQDVENSTVLAIMPDGNTVVAIKSILYICSQVEVIMIPAIDAKTLDGRKDCRTVTHWIV